MRSMYQVAMYYSGSTEAVRPGRQWGWTWATLAQVELDRRDYARRKDRGNLVEFGVRRVWVDEEDLPVEEDPTRIEDQEWQAARDIADRVEHVIELDGEWHDLGDGCEVALRNEHFVLSIDVEYADPHCGVWTSATRARYEAALAKLALDQDADLVASGVEEDGSGEWLQFMPLWLDGLLAGGGGK